MTELLTPDLLAAQPLDHALALSARCYTDPRMPALDARAVFAKSWQLVCHQSQLAGVGDHRVTTIAGLPIVVVRSDERTLRAFHNVCRHRAGPVASCDGCSKVALSIIVAGSNTVMSAYIPGLSKPRSLRPTRCAASDVIFLTANSRVITESCLT